MRSKEDFIEENLEREEDIEDRLLHAFIDGDISKEVYYSILGMGEEEEC